MNRTAKFFALLAVVALVVLIALLLSGKKPASGPQTVATSKGETNPSPSHIASHPRTNKTARLMAVIEARTNTAAGPNWNVIIDTVLTSEAEPGEKGATLLALLPRVPAEEQAAAAQHVANLLADEDYEQFGLQLANTNTPPDVQDIIFADVMDRPDKIKLPLLLEVAKTPDHPKATESKELLELYLEKDYGNDWELWKTKIDDWLKKNPD
jgi:hypothetical protein